MDNKKYVDYILEQAENLINIDSPSGYGEGVTQYLLDEFGKMGYHAYRTGKGSVIADLGGEDENDAILLEGHCDTLGAMVHEIKADGHLKLTNIGKLACPLVHAVEFCDHADVLRLGVVGLHPADVGEL